MFRYCGEYFDKETDTIYLRARYYDPEIGRFTSEDSFLYMQYKDPLSLNLYTYCHNNPIQYIDPSGHTIEEDKKVLSSKDFALIEALTQASWRISDKAIQDVIHLKILEIRTKSEYNGKYTSVDKEGNYKDNTGYKYLSTPEERANVDLSISYLTKGEAAMYRGELDIPVIGAIFNTFTSLFIDGIMLSIDPIEVRTGDIEININSYTKDGYGYDLDQYKFFFSSESGKYLGKEIYKDIAIYGRAASEIRKDIGKRLKEQKRK